MFTKHRLTFATALMSLLLLSCPAMAQYDPDGDPAEESTEEGDQEEIIRNWGMGTRLGAGYLGGTFIGASGDSYTTGTGLKLELPTLEFRYFLRGGNSLDISWGVVPTVIMAAVEKFYIDPFVSYSFNFGKGSTRFSVAPGLRVIMGAGNGQFVYAFRVPVNLAVEFLTAGRGFGFQIFARPYFHLQPGDNTAVGGGIMGGIAFMGYSTN